VLEAERPKWGLRVLCRAVLVGIVLLLGAEAVLRWCVGLGDPPLARLDRVTEYELIPSAHYRRWGNFIAINANGMRAPDHAPWPGPAERRVLLIGDSVVYGNHFLDQAETIAAQLTGDLATNPRLAGCTVLALPMAVSSWGPANQAAALRRDGTFGAHAAAIVLSAHDLYDVPRLSADILPYQLTRSWTAIGDAVTALVLRKSRETATTDLRPLEARAQLSLIALGDMVGQLRAAGIMPKLVYHPTTGERAGSMRHERATLTDWAWARGIETIDLGAEITTADGYRDTIHPNALGAARIARVLARSLAPDLPLCDE